MEDTDICDNKMSLEDCEISLLRHAVDKEEMQQKKNLKNETVDEIISILKEFMIRRKVICYGGTAINNILPLEDRFYGEEEIPDFDFFSMTPLTDAKTLTNIYFNKGFHDVECKAAVHPGTFKVFVNFIPIADITYLEKTIFKVLMKEVIVVNKIQYAPPNYLKMSMFLELSRPEGDISRWEKVFLRLKLLNKHYPFSPHRSCLKKNTTKKAEEISDNLFEILVSHDVVFFGGYAFHLYSEFSKRTINKKIQQNKFIQYDVLSDNVDNMATSIVQKLKEKDIEASIKNYPAVGEIIPRSAEIHIDGKTWASLYEPIACHSYNEVFSETLQKIIKIATINTMLSFYLAFIYVDLKKYNKNRILCMAEILFDIEQKHRTETKGILNQFSIQCFGKQKTIQDIRTDKLKKFDELKHHKNSKEYEWWFINYQPKRDGLLQVRHSSHARQSNRTHVKANKTKKSNHKPRKHPKRHTKKNKILNLIPL